MQTNIEVNQTDTNVYQDVPPGQRYRVSRRGEANSLRRGHNKIHRRHQPRIANKAPRGIAARLLAQIKSHDWNRNPDLFKLRQRGYTPYSRAFDPTFTPKPLRLSVRSESREALTSFHTVLAANCDFNPDNDYMFEVMESLEKIAAYMGVLHRYENGRKAYDIAVHAMRVSEEMGEIVVAREYDPDSGQYKPVRIFLTERFFINKGIPLDDLRLSLHRFRQWAEKNGLRTSLQEKYQRHLLYISRVGINIDKMPSLKNRLKQIKRWVVSPDLRKEKEEVEQKIKDAIENKKVVKIERRPMSSRWAAFENSGKLPSITTIRLVNNLRSECPDLLRSDPDEFYRRLLKEVGEL